MCLSDDDGEKERSGVNDQRDIKIEPSHIGIGDDILSGLRSGVEEAQETMIRTLRLSLWYAADSYHAAILAKDGKNDAETARWIGFFDHVQASLESLGDKEISNLSLYWWSW